MLRKLWLLLISLLLGVFFLPQSSYAENLVPVSDGFDFPLGKPNGAGYGVECCGGLGYLERYDYERDGVKEYHPGEDWNSDSGSDAGDPVYAISDGLIVYARYSDPEWGYLVLIEHKMRGGQSFWSQYAHLKSISEPYRNGSIQRVERGATIGRVGDFWHNSGNAYHLHFEIRKKFRSATAFVMDWSKAKVQEYYVNPSEFIKANRPVPPPEPQKLAIKDGGQGVAEISWDEAAGKGFKGYELYRAEEKGATLLEDRREKILAEPVKKTLKHADLGLYAGQKYYYRLYTYYDNDVVVASNEVNIFFERETIRLTDKAGVQRYIGISNDKIYWEDTAREQTSFPQKKTFYYYDVADESIKTITIGSAVDNIIQGPYKPQAENDWLCYYGKKRTGSYDIFCRNMADEMPADYQITNSAGDENDPRISGNILVWQGYEGTVRRIYWTNLADGAKINQLSETVGQQYTPQIWGNNIIWKNQEAVGKPLDLIIKNIETGVESVIAADIDSGTIDIWDKYVIYNKGGKLLAAEIDSPEKITEFANDGLNARMRDGKIVYAKLGKDGSYYIYVYIMESRKTISVAGPLKYQPSPVVYENMVVYNDSPAETSTDMDIYLTWL